MKSVNRDPYPPMRFPSIILGLMALTLIVGVATRETSGLLPTKAASELQDHQLSPAGFGLVLICVLVYCLIAETVGFIIASCVILLTLTLWMRPGWRWVVGISALLPPLAYGLFAHVLRVPLPQGWLGW